MANSATFRNYFVGNYLSPDNALLLACLRDCAHVSARLEQYYKLAIRAIFKPIRFHWTPCSVFQ